MEDDGGPTQDTEDIKEVLLTVSYKTLVCRRSFTNIILRRQMR